MPCKIPITSDLIAGLFKKEILIKKEMEPLSQTFLKTTFCETSIAHLEAKDPPSILQRGDPCKKLA